MRKLYPTLILAGLFLAQGFTIFTRGGYYRLYWIPAATLIGLLLAGFLIGWNHGWFSPRFNLKTDLPLLGFLGWACLSGLTTVNREETFFEITRLFLLVAVYFLVAYALDKEKKKLLVYLLLTLTFLDAVYGLSGFISGRPLLDLSWIDLPQSRFSVSGTFLNHNHFAGLMEMSVFLGFGLIVAVRRRDRPWSEQVAERVLISLPCGIIVLALILSLSRGGWMSFLLSLPFFLSLFWWHAHPLWSRVLVISLIVGLVVSAFILRVNRDPLIQRIETLSSFIHQSEELTTDARLSIYKSSLAMIQDHPWTGTGWGTFHSVFPSYRKDNLLLGIVFAHNDYLQIAAGMGLPGLGLFLLFILMLFKEGFRVIRDSTQDFWALAMPGILAGLLAVLLHGFVDFNLMLPSNAMFFLSLAGLVAARGREVA